MRRIEAFLSEESGLETVEYSVIAGLVVVGVIAAIALIGRWVRSTLEGFNDSLSAATPLA
jgi:Flp pilus assembly pilin Flp